MKNVGPREAGSITAAQFLQRFVDDGVAWAHLDIAGMAWSDKAKPTYDKGATGFGVRLLDQYIADAVEGADCPCEAGTSRCRVGDVGPRLRRGTICASISTSSAQRSPTGSSRASPASCSTTGSGCWSSPADEGLLARLDRQLWDQGAASFLPHGLAGGADDAAQPILLSTGTDAPNLARNILIADGEWREAALGYDRAFYLFDDATLEGARLAWKLLAGRDGVERNYWALEDGKLGRRRAEPCPSRRSG